MDTELEQSSRNCSKYFSLSTSSTSQQPDTYIIEDVSLGIVELEKNIILPFDFTPRDIAYHEIGEDMILLGICGGNQMIFASMQKKTNEIFLLPQRIELNFGKKAVDEFLMVIKSGFLHTQEKGITKTEEIFITAGKYGIIYIFIFRPDQNEIIKLDFFEAHLNQINDISLANGLEKPHLRNLIITCSNDGSTVIWDILDKQALVRLFPSVLPLDEVLAVDWSDSGDEIITASLDNLRIWNLDKEVTTFLKQRGQREPHQKFKARQIREPAAKIKNFHNFYVDYVRLLPNGAIATKSINGEVSIWTYEMDQNKNEAFAIQLCKYAIFSSMNIQDKMGFGIVKPQVLGYDNLIILPQERRHKVKMHYMRNKYDMKAYAEFEINSNVIKEEKFMILKALVPEGGMDAIIVLTNNRIFYATTTRMDAKLQDQNED